MICNCIEEFSIKHIEGQLEPEARCKFEKHIAECHKCKNRYNEVRNNYDKALMVNGEIDLTASVMSKIYSIRRPYRKFKFTPLLTGFAEVAAFVLILFLLPSVVRQFNNARSAKLPNDNPAIVNTINKTEERGIIITLKDKTPSDKVEDIVHTEDIISVVGEIKEIGGDSISINGIPLTDDSEITPIGAFILIRNKKEAANASNEKKLASPFVIEAKGNVNVMLERLALKESIIQQLKSRGIYVVIEKENKVQ